MVRRLFLAFLIVFAVALPAAAQTVSPPVTLTASVARRQSMAVVPTHMDLGELPYANGLWLIPQPITVYWQFNGNLPWYMRIYTDNEPLVSVIPRAASRLDVIGLVSEDGLYNIPIRVWNLNVGPEETLTGWNINAMDAPPLIPPFSGGITDPSSFGVPVDRDLYSAGGPAWVRLPDRSEMTADPESWRVIQGVDPLDARRVSAADPSGDFTLGNPIQIWLALDIGPLAAGGRHYQGNVVIDFISQ